MNHTREPLMDRSAVSPLTSNQKARMWHGMRTTLMYSSFFLSEPVAFRRVYGLESYSRTSGESNLHRQSVSDTRMPRYQLSHEDDYINVFIPAWMVPPMYHSLRRENIFFSVQRLLASARSFNTLDCMLHIG